MRQVGDTLVWLALVAVVAAALYLTPLLASFVSSRDPDAFHGGRGGVAWRAASDTAGEAVEGIR